MLMSQQTLKYRSLRRTHAKLNPNLLHLADDRDHRTIPEVAQHPRLETDDSAAIRVQCPPGIEIAVTFARGKITARCDRPHHVVRLEV
jgi:hypothetical protein